MSSIRGALLAGLLAAAILAAALVAAGAYRVAYNETNELFDTQLQEMGLALRDRVFAGEGPAVDEGDEFLIQVWDPGGAAIFRSSARVAAPVIGAVGLSTVAGRDDDWRVYRIDAERQIVQVAQPMRLRRARAAGIALRVIAPLAALVPALAILMWAVVGRGLAPLTAFARALAARGPHAPAPIASAGLPFELRPLAGALNDLLARLGDALERERTFIADAAHALRTPLAAVALQVQLLERTPAGPGCAPALERLKAGVQRSVRLVQQLLVLARQGATPAAAPQGRVDLAALAREVVAEAAAFAESRGIDLGLDAAEARVAGDAEGLRVLLANLVENAVRYTPAGGAVDVRVRAEGAEAIAEVLDTGPGIAQGERGRVFDRFYRGSPADGPGSGLGLAIVREIAARHDATVDLHARESGPGLCVRLRLRRA